MRHGEMTEEEAAVHPQRHILTRALGCPPRSTRTCGRSSSARVTASCSAPTGCRTRSASTRWTRSCATSRIPTEAAQRLVDAANENGGADNITVIVVDVQVGEEGNGTRAKVTPLGFEAATLTVGVATHRAAGAAGAADAGAERPMRPMRRTRARTAPEPPGSPQPAPTPEGEPPTEATPALRPDDTLAPGSRLASAASRPRWRDRTTQRRVLPGPADRRRARGALDHAVPPPPGPRRDDEPPEKESRGARRRRLGIPRRVTFRVIGFVLLVAAVPVAAYYVLRWYAYDNWIVTLQGNQIVMKQGQPGGVLWFHPKVVDRTGQDTSEVLPVRRRRRDMPVSRSPRSSAQEYVCRSWRPRRRQRPRPRPPRPSRRPLPGSLASSPTTHHDDYGGDSPMIHTQGTSSHLRRSRPA